MLWYPRDERSTLMVVVVHVAAALIRRGGLSVRDERDVRLTTTIDAIPARRATLPLLHAAFVKHVAAGTSEMFGVEVNWGIAECAVAHGLDLDMERG
jgi:hypothetical protein